VLRLPLDLLSFGNIQSDEVGMEIENAFQLLPLQQLAAGVQNAVESQVLSTMPEVSVP